MRSRSLLIYACLSLSALLAFGQVAQPAKPARALTLNRFAQSRLTSTDAQGFYFMPIAIGDDYFDGTSSPERVERHMRLAREIGARYLRCAFSWNAIEKQRGHYQWAFWDHLVEAAQQNGIELIPYVAYTPEWAASSKESFWAQPPSDPQLYADFMGKVADRYRDKIHAWEIWNEPDNRDYWRGSAEQFATLVELAAVEIRRSDPNAVLVLGGMSLGPGDFFQSLLRWYHVDRYVDVIAMHAYPETWAPLRTEREYHDWIDGMEQLIREGGTGVDFWVNEMGYADYRFKIDQASKYGIGIVYRYEHTADFAAVSLFKAETMALASGKPSLTGWYRIDDFAASETRLGGDGVNYHLGIVDSGGHRKPAYFALRFFRSVFDRPVRTIATDHPGQALVDVFEKKDGHLVVVAWLRSSDPAEVDDTSGLARDPRKEQVSVPLPCRSISKLEASDAQGRKARQRLRFSDGVLSGLQLTGDQVAVLQMSCRKGGAVKLLKLPF